MTLEERFWAKVEITVFCWNWTGAKSDQGYGNIEVRRRVPEGVHRISYRWAKGDIPDGMEIDHLCRNRACVNPVHLEAVTRRVNQLRGDAFAAREARLTHCPKGHPYSIENTYRYPSGSRRCRRCNREQKKTRYHKNVLERGAG